MCRSGLAVLRARWQDQRAPFASLLAGSNRGPSHLVPPLPKAAPAYRENRRGWRKVTLIALKKLLRVHELSFALGPSENDHKPVGNADPYLLVLGAQIYVRFLNNLRVQCPCSPNSAIKVVHLEPQ